MSVFDEQLSRLNNAQRAAVEHTDGPVLVIAGPGTGKTQLLSTRAAYILRHRDVLPHNILCLTFTESGAFAMRQRLVNIIGQQAYNITISTYHAFGSELISRFGDYFSDQMDAEPIDELGMHRIIAEIVEGLPFDNPLKYSERYQYDVLRTISEAKQALLSPEDLRKVLQSNETFIKTASRHSTKVLSGLARIDKKSLPRFAELAKQTASLGAASPLRGVQSIGEMWQTELETALDEAADVDKTTPITAWKNKWLTKNAENEYVVDGSDSIRKLGALADVYEQYLQRLQAEHLYDYDDMILRAIDGLVNHPELKYQLQEQYQYIMLDEFQDTNGAQLQLVRLLTDNPLYENKPNILAVGDDDQAIYAFQGADYSHMRTFQAMYEDVFTVTLTKNYRSHAHILETAHNISDQIGERLHHFMPEVNKTLEAAAADMPPKTAIARHEFKSDIAQFAWVTKEIAKLLKEGASADQIAVIAPRHKYLEPLVPYLAQGDIPVRYEKRENILEDIHIVQLTRISQLVLALQADDMATADSLWPEVLSYDFWQLDTETIWSLSWQAQEKQASWLQTLHTDKATQAIASFMGQLAQLSRFETLETMLDLIIGNQSVKLGKQMYVSPFYQHYFGAARREDDQSGFWNVLSNLTVLRQRLRGAMRANREMLLLKDLVSFIEGHQAAGIKVLNTSPYHESQAAVQLMTAHKSKGLEFEHVFLLACVDEAWGSRTRSQTNRISLPPNLNFIRYGGATDDEKLRLLYVAITRAKRSLYLTSYANTYDNRITSRLKYFNEVEEGNTVRSLVLPSQYQVVSQNDTTAPNISDLQSYWTNRHIESARQATFQSLLQERLDRFQLAASHISTFTDVVFAGPDAFFLHTLLRFPTADTPNSVFGNIIHQTIEWLHHQQKAKGELPTLKQANAHFQDQLSRAALSDNDKSLLSARGKRSIEAVLSQLGESFHVDDEHEFNFRNQGVFLKEAHLTGKIDKLSIDRKQRTVQITDYKTGKSFDTWKSGEVKLLHFKQQLYFYKLLVEGSYTFADYRVTDACIQFVEPDENGKLHTLHLVFNDKEQQRLATLAQAVFARIKKLDFPDISKYPTTIHGVRQFEADLIGE